MIIKNQEVKFKIFESDLNVIFFQISQKIKSQLNQKNNRVITLCDIIINVIIRSNINHLILVLFN